MSLDHIDSSFLNLSAKNLAHTTKIFVKQSFNLFWGVNFGSPVRLNCVWIITSNLLRGFLCTSLADCTISVARSFL